MTTPTNYYLRQQLKNIATSKTSRASSSGAINSQGVTEEAENQEISLETMKFNKIGAYGNEIITNNDTHARILQPMPCMRWAPKSAPDENGVVTLKEELEATILTIGDESICLGFTGTYCGVSTELELLIDLGDTELLMNNEFYSVKAKHHAKDGVEI